MTRLQGLLLVLVSAFSVGLMTEPLPAQPFGGASPIPGAPSYLGDSSGDPTSVWYKQEKLFYTFYFQDHRVYYQSHFKTFHSAVAEVPGNGQLRGDSLAAIVYLGQLQLYGCGLDGQIYINVKQPRGDWSGWFTFAFHPPATGVHSGYVYRNSAGNDNVFIFFWGTGRENYALRFSEAHRWDVVSLGSGFDSVTAVHTGVGNAFFAFGIAGGYSYSNFYAEDSADPDYGDFQGWNLADPLHPQQKLWDDLTACNFSNRDISRAIRVYTLHPGFLDENSVIYRSEADAFDRMGGWVPILRTPWLRALHVTSISFPTRHYTILMVCSAETSSYLWMIAKERR